jgi:hypothetical protein
MWLIPVAIPGRIAESGAAGIAPDHIAPVSYPLPDISSDIYVGICPVSQSARDTIREKRMIIPKNSLPYAAVILLLVPPVVGFSPQKVDYRVADQNEKTNCILSMEKIRKLGEVEKAINEIFDKAENTDVRDAWNDHGIGAQGSIAASTQVTDKEFPQIATAIHKAGFSTRDYVVCYLTLVQTQHAVYFKRDGKSKEYPPYVNPANIKLLEDHWNEVVRIMNPPRS